MKRIQAFSLVLATLVVAGSSLAQPTDPAGSIELPGEGPVGDWMGTLDVGQVELRLALHVEAAEDGTLSAVLHSVDQNARIPVDALAVEERTWRLTADRIGATFTGTMSADGSAVDGTWSQGGQSLPLRLARLVEPFALARPQHPQPPFPYASREVTFRNEAGGIRLAGTLVVPPGDGPFPAVVFVTGSGAQDRDETLFGHKPFLVLADYLARRGVASLRYDDRGFGESEGDHMGSTVADFAADVAAGLAFLAAQPKIDRDALGILGHSEGGLAAPRVAASNAEVDFLVLLAPPGERLVRVLPGLNHLFQHSASGAVAEYGTIEETFAPQALDVVGDWIEERFAGARPLLAPSILDESLL